MNETKFLDNIAKMQYADETIFGNNEELVAAAPVLFKFSEIKECTPSDIRELMHKKREKKRLPMKRLLR